eukprot:667799-Prymnesium_polylepis.1
MHTRGGVVARGADLGERCHRTQRREVRGRQSGPGSHASAQDGHGASRSSGSKIRPRRRTQSSPPSTCATRGR